MEGNENETENPIKENSKLNSAIAMNNNINTFSADETPALFSTVLTLYVLILLYFPRLFFKLILSPVPILTLTLLLALLRFGATQKQEQTQTRSNCNSEAADRLLSDSNNSHDPQDHKWASTEASNIKPDHRFEDSFVEWNVRAPLEVIYEAYEEGEEEETEGNNNDPTRFGIERYPSLSLCYPESDSDCSSTGDYPAIGDWGSAECVSLRWEDEDREELIEIALDGVNSNENNDRNDSNKREMAMELDFMGNFHGEEENNLIEIDISGVKHEEDGDFLGRGN
ncbi:uncharacterized protein LOC123192764 [Mangifera indica]|uniref:uncharacterized protein LOC123192764 n=1 Tax=Mangifera indica TaxID=29780 RepID=UPI001CFC277C|nr:uncharacterized protein LOC123192764 [Mangifera indica]